MGYVYLYTGNGGGKTTNALGIALRCIGHNKKVIIFQFLKWWKETGEVLFNNPNYKIYQYGRKDWHGFSNLTAEDRKICEWGFKEMEAVVSHVKPHVVVLDELALAVYLKLISIDDIKFFLKYLPEETHLVITGRHATKELKELADFVIEIRQIKMPKELVSVEGINY